MRLALAAALRLSLGDNHVLVCVSLTSSMFLRHSLFVCVSSLSLKFKLNGLTVEDAHVSVCLAKLHSETCQFNVSVPVGP